MGLTDCLHEDTHFEDSARCESYSGCIIHEYECETCGATLYEHSCGLGSVVVDR